MTSVAPDVGISSPYDPDHHDPDRNTALGEELDAPKTTHHRLEVLAQELGLHLVHSREDLARLTTGRSISNVLGSALTDLAYFPTLSKVAASFFIGEIRRRLGLEDKTLVHAENADTCDDKQNLTILLVSGFLAPDRHMGALKQRLNGSSRYSEAVRPSRSRSVLDDAQALCREITAIKGPIEIAADSRGGLVTECALPMLDAQTVARLRQVVLISPPSNGINADLTGLGETAAAMGLSGVRDLLPGSPAVRFWQEKLTAELRKLIVILGSIGGDVFMGPSQVFVEGSSHLFAQNESHQRQVLDENSPIFQAAVQILSPRNQ